MKKYIIFIAGVCVFLITAAVFAVNEPSGQPFQAIWDAINSLRNQVANIQLTPGPQGPEGPMGPQGPQGEKGDPGEPSWDEARVAKIESQVSVLTEKVNQIWDIVNRECAPGDTQACNTGQNGICSNGTKTCNQQGIWGQCVQNNQPTAEICGNGLDDNCDGHDENCPVLIGTLNVLKSANTPATGNIAAGSAVKLATFSFQVKGEEVKTTALSVTITATGFTPTDITNIALYDKNDRIVAGPKDPNTSFVAAFTDTFIIPVGNNDYSVKATIADSAVTGYTLKASITTPGTTSVLTLTGMTSNNSIQATPTGTVDGNIMTIAGGALTVTTLASPDQ